MAWSRYVLAYHGCDEETARRIVSGADDLKPSRNDYDWLGHGQYFWEEGYERAMRWAIQEAKATGSAPQRIKIPGVLGAIIDLGHCLDLVQVEYLDLVKDAHDRLLQLFEGIQKSPPANKGKEMSLRKLDCAVFEALHEFRNEASQTPFDTVRAFFTEGDALYPTAGIRKLDHIQICVRNTASIVGYFLPRKQMRKSIHSS